MSLLLLPPRDLPSTLLAAVGGVVAGVDPFPGYEGPVEFASAGEVLAVTADAIPHVKIFVGQPGSYRERASFYAYDPRFGGGVNLATDGQHVATGTDRGAPHVREFSLRGTESRSYFAGDPESLYGVRVGYAMPDSSPVAVRPEAKVQIYLDGADADTVRGVADLFAPFDVGVANRYPLNTDPRRIATVILGGSSGGPERGFAVEGGFFQQSETTSHPARVFSDGLTTYQTIRAAGHEAAHLFGATHVTDPRALMFPGIDGGSTFDPLNRAILTQRLGRR